MPIRLSALPVVAECRQLYRAFDFGRLLRLKMLDERQYRADQACTKGLRGGGRVLTLAECPGIEVMIGADAPVRNIELRLDCTGSGRDNGGDQHPVGLQLPRTQDGHTRLDRRLGRLCGSQRVVDLMEKHRDQNPVVISGDVHSHFVTRVLKDWKDASLVHEFVCTAIPLNLRNYEPWAALGGGSEPTIVDLDCRHHGYTVCDVTGDTFEVTARRVVPHAGVATIEDARAETSYAYRIAAGDPEPHKV